MAGIKYSRLCRGIRQDKQTGKYSFDGVFERLTLSRMPVLFVFAVCWDGKVGETFKQSFALVDSDGSVLDAIPETKFVLDKDLENIGIGYFYVTFPSIGEYSICVYQNGKCIETIPLTVIPPDSNIVH